MTLPRENRLVRFYIQLKDFLGKEATGSSKSSPERLAGMAESIMKPYKLAFTHCDWWSLYHVRVYIRAEMVKLTRKQVGQRLVKQYRPHER